MITIEAIRARIEAALEVLLVSANGSSCCGADRLISAMRYSTLGSGSRIRSTLLVSIVEGAGGNVDAAVNIGAALECVHSYTLVHDDLPAFDNAMFRRGKPSCHMQFGDVTAVLAGNSLFAKAFEIIMEEGRISAEDKVRICSVLARAFGANGVMCGQELDSMICGDMWLPEFQRAQFLKTAVFFVAVCEVASIMSGICPSEANCLLQYARYFGYAYQVRDDINDALCEERNLVRYLTLDKVKILFKHLMSKSLKCLDPVGGAVRERLIELSTTLSV